MINTLEEYKNYLIIIKNRSNKTVENYMSDLNLFFNYVSARHNVENVDFEFISSLNKQDVYSYLAMSQEKGDKATTRARRVASIRCFYLWLEQEYDVKTNIKMVEKPKIEKTLPKFLTEEEARALIEVSKTTKYPQRDQAMVVLFLNCGMRISELQSLKIADVKGKDSLVINGKGAKERTIYLNESCKRAINEYLGTRDDDNPYLWNSYGNRGMTCAAIGKNVKAMLVKIGRGDCSTHKLRHTSATLMHKAGTDVLVIKEILGHESVATTQIYTHVLDEQLRQAVENNPINL